MKDLEQDFATMNKKFYVNYEISAEELVDIDLSISISSSSSDADIIAEVSSSPVVDSDDDSEVQEIQGDEVAKKPTSADVMNAISML